MMTKKEECSCCRFWKNHMRRGPICRRHPPVIARYAERFPNIMSDDWCGEFERIKTSEEKKECVQGQTVLSK